MRGFLFVAIPSGQLNDIITVQIAVTNQSPQVGEDLLTWNTVIPELPSAFQYLGTRQFPESFRTYAETTARCLVRKTPTTWAIDSALHRILFDGKTWHLTGNPVKSDDMTILTLELAERK